MFSFEIHQGIRCSEILRAPICGTRKFLVLRSGPEFVGPRTVSETLGGSLTVATYRGATERWDKYRIVNGADLLGVQPGF